MRRRGVKTGEDIDEATTLSDTQIFTALDKDLRASKEITCTRKNVIIARSRIIARDTYLSPKATPFHVYFLVSLSNQVEPTLSKTTIRRYPSCLKPQNIT